MASDTDIEMTILEMIAEVNSVAPREVAQRLAKEGEDWRKYLTRIREQASVLHTKEKLVFVRKRKIVSPEGLKGVYRLARPGVID